MAALVPPAVSRHRWHRAPYKVAPESTSSALHCDDCELSSGSAQLNCWPPNRAQDANESGAEEELPKLKPTGKGSKKL